MRLGKPAKPKKKDRRSFNFRAPDDVEAYLERKESEGESLTDVIVESVRVYRILEKRLMHREPELGAFADENRLEYEPEYAQVIALAVQTLLDARLAKQSK